MWDVGDVGFCPVGLVLEMTRVLVGCLTPESVLFDVSFCRVREQMAENS